MKAHKKPKEIAVVGCGVAGLTAAWLLSRKHEVHLFEKNDYIGGHTRTLKIEKGTDKGLKVDTGFIVMNHRNYPLFTKVLDELGVELADSTMTFSFFDRKSGYGYSGNSIGTLFPKLGYYFMPKHLGLIRDLFRFARIGYRDLNSGYLKGKTLGEYFSQRRFGDNFLENYFYPMGAAIWSSPVEEMQNFSAQPYLHFLENHGLLRLTNRPQWKYVVGGSRTYVKAMLKCFTKKPHLNAAPKGIYRMSDGVVLRTHEGKEQKFDHLVIGAHADEALKILDDPDEEETANLSPWRYQANEVVLHTSETQLPPDPRQWSSWNFIREPGDGRDRPVLVSYYMNRLQDLQTEENYVVTLNAGSAIPEDKVINRTTLTHPLYSEEALDSQSRLHRMNGKRHTWFCGSYFGYGFHEDAVRSAVEVAKGFGIEL
ncbi:MAG: NAD(P)/FAD-dependent oxidoreductase [Opitutales bacterium]